MNNCFMYELASTFKTFSVRRGKDGALRGVYGNTFAQTRLLPPKNFISVGGCPRKNRLPSHNISRPRVVGGRISSSWCCSANGKQTWGTRWDPGRINSSCAHYTRLSTTVDIVHQTVVTGRDAATITTSQISKRALVNSLDHLGQLFHARQLDHHHHAPSLPP